MAKVFLGVGHGGSDPGTVANGLKEANMNLTMALGCRDELIRHGVTVLMSRTTDENDDLAEEIRECNNFNPDLAIDIHNNSGGGDGFEAFYHHGGGKGLTLAKNIEEEVKAIGQNSRGCKIKKNSQGNDYFGFIRNTICPAIIVEGVFLDSNDRFIADEYHEQIAFGKAYAKGILKTLGIKYINGPSNNIEESKETYYRCIAGSFKEKANAEKRKKELEEKGFTGVFLEAFKK